jgi:type VI secretion system protein
MQLKLSVSSVQGPSLGPDAQARFRLRGGTIGRARDNDWVLPDPERIVSGHHARILYEQGGYYLEDTSSNGTFLNGQATPLPQGQLTELQHGDLIAIGDYEIRVELEDDAGPSAAQAWSSSNSSSQPTSTPASQSPPAFIGKPYAPPSQGPAATPSDGDRAPGQRSASAPDDPDPWAAQRYPASTTQAPSGDGWAGVQPDHLAPDAANFRPPSATPERIPEEGESAAPDEILPDDWWKIDDEPTDAPSATPQPGVPGTPPAQPDIPEPLEPFSEPARVQPPSQPAVQTAAEPAAPEPPPAPPPRPEPPPAQAAPTPAPPWPASPSSSGREPAPVSEPAPDSAPNSASESDPELASQPVSPPAQPAPPPPQSAPPSEQPASLSATALADAYFSGMGLSAPDLSAAETEALFRQTGRLMRMLTDGLMEVLKTRSTLKSEFRLSQTIVQSAENNPLKFCVNADQALAQLFLDKRPGFMAPEASFGEALTDVKQHQLAVVAGMRAAFDCLLSKFDPETVEAAQAAAGKKRAGLFADKYWDFYRDYHADFKANAGDDFRGIFGEDFVRAYEAQIQRLLSGDHDD